MVDPAKEPKLGGKLDRVCPPDIGQKDWEPPAFSPHTGLLYVGIFNICMDLTDHKVSYIAGTPYDGMEMERFSVDGKDGDWGAFIAWDPVAGQGGVAHPRKVHGHVGHDRHRRRPGVLRHDRRLVPRARCADRQAAVAAEAVGPASSASR